MGIRGQTRSLCGISVAINVLTDFLSINMDHPRVVAYLKDKNEIFEHLL